MDRFALDNPEAKEKRSVDDKKSKMLKDLGLEHEAKVLAEMQAMGKSIVRIETKDKDQAAAETLAALKSGADVVYQAYLRDLTLAGYADCLVRVERHSKLGAFSYEVWDSKLAQHVKPYYVIQLCAYAEMLEKIQGHLPHKMAVVLGDGVIEHLDLDQFVHYYRRVKKAFFDFQESFDGSPRPDPEKYRSFGNWDDYAQEILEEADSLTQVAGIRGRHVALLQESGIKTMTALAQAKGREVKGLAAEVLARLQRQSACQIKSKGKDRPICEVLDHKDYEGEKGLYMLPPSTDADVYFDMEGFPLAKDGLEYLWGAVHKVKGEWQFRDF